MKHKAGKEKVEGQYKEQKEEQDNKIEEFK